MERPFPAISLSFWAVLLISLSTDLVFIGADLLTFVAEKLGWIIEVPPVIKITRDGSLPEIVGYVKWAIIIAALLRLAFRDRWAAPARWALVFVMILADDSLQIHERLGLYLWDVIPFPPSLHDRGDDISELIVFGAMGLLAIALTASLFFRHGPVAKALSIRFLWIVAGLVFFGVFLDFVHQLVSSFSQGTVVQGYLPPLFSLLEDGGEMVVASFATAFVLTLPGIESLRAHPASR